MGKIEKKEEKEREKKKKKKRKREKAVEHNHSLLTHQKKNSPIPHNFPKPKSTTHP